MKIECMKNLIYTFVGSATLVLLTSCSAEFENGTPDHGNAKSTPMKIMSTPSSTLVW